MHLTMRSFKKQVNGNYVASQQQSHQPVTRRVMGTSSQLRSPVVRRMTTAPIVMQGWLYKQGSEGLMLWKKRWFVLAEYCLFYYKNPDEEKLLGSILLPSYKISPCSAIEGKVFRKKYSFKAEHVNMRTYYFAADSKDQMVQWMNAMSLATIAQQQQQCNGIYQSHVQPKNDKFDFHFPNNHCNGVQIGQTIKNDIVSNTLSPSNLCNERVGSFSSNCSNDGVVTDIDALVENSVQPLYVNAPPKPRRTAEPSDALSELGYANNCSSHDRLYLHQSSANKSLKNINRSQLNERHTPDVYCWSSSVDPRTVTNSCYRQSNTDWEELYNITMMNIANSPERLNSNYVPLERRDTNMSSLGRVAASRKINRLPSANRPHSVDFLESEDNTFNDEKTTSSSEIAMSQNTSITSQKDSRQAPPPRPKSSIDVVNMENFYWTEERYAQNMRRSAQYLVAKKSQDEPIDLMPNYPENRSSSRGLSQDTSFLSSPRTSINDKNQRLCSSETFGDISSNQTLSSVRVVTKDGEAPISRSTCLTSQAFDNRRHDYRATSELRNDSSQSDFTRSRSARMPREKQLDQQKEKSIDELFLYKRRNSLYSSESVERSNQQVQQREESMKRLLEWKQRMLQSPLSRKLSGSSNRGTAQNEIFTNYKPFPAVQPDTSRIAQTSENQAEQNYPHYTESSKDFPVNVNDTNCSLNDVHARLETKKNEVSVYQQLSPHRDPYQEEDLISSSSIKYNTESSDSEKSDEPKEARKRYRRASSLQLLSKSKTASNKSRSSPPYTFVGNPDTRNTETCDVHKRVNILASGEDNWIHSDKHLDMACNTLKEDSNSCKGTTVDTSDTLNTLPPGSSTVVEARTDNLTEVKVDVNSRYECLRPNIVQDRIRVFENSEDGKTEKLHMKEPLKVSSAQEPNQALVAPIKSYGIDDSPLTDHLSVNVSTLENVTENNVIFCKTDWKKARYLEENTRSPEELHKLNVNMNQYESGADDVHIAYVTADVDTKSKDGSELVFCTNETVTEPMSKTEASSSTEDHYLPMAPSKKSVFSAAPGDLFYHTRSNSASSASQILILETLLSEDVENSYVEMTTGGDGRMYQESKKAQTEEKTVEVDNGGEQSALSHYEFLYKASSSNEPLYMEVMTKDKWTSKLEDNNMLDKMNASKKYSSLLTGQCRTVLPDILNSSSSVRPLTDSSDADDEASKELDPLDVPQHPRFSLSDTFRPASYYLGCVTGNTDGCSNSYNTTDHCSSLNLSFEQPDSSDSDLVSPPPIPTSPASLDDFDVSLELLSSKMDTTSMQENKYSGVTENTSTSENESYTSKSSNFSHKRGTCKNEKDASDLESTVDSYSSTITTLPEPTYDEYVLERDTPKIPFFKDRESDENQAHYHSVPNSAASVFTEQRAQSMTQSSGLHSLSSVLPPPSEMFRISSGTGSDNIAGAPYYYADLLKSNTDSISDGSGNIPALAELSNNCGTANKGRMSDEVEKVISRSNEDMLNNKRDHFFIENLSKRDNIGKKVNQILAESQSSFDKNNKLVGVKNSVQFPQAPEKNVDDKNIYSSHLFHNKLNKTSYYRSKTPEPLSDAFNLYALHSQTRIGDGSSTSTDSRRPNRRSRSLEGLLDESSKNNPKWCVNNDHKIGDDAINSVAAAAVGSNENTFRRNESAVQTSVSTRTDTTTSDDVWEEDTLWRETLRRMSLRHARSLDDLDKDCQKVTSVSGRQSADILATDEKKSTKKVTRDVTYVNDCVTAQVRKAKQNSKEYTEDYREVRRIKRYVRSPVSDGSADDGVHYERLDPRATLTTRYYNGSESRNDMMGVTRTATAAASMKQQHGRHNTQPKSGAQSFLEEGVYPTKPPSFEIDREKLRQWDLMSSAPVAMSNAIQKYPVLDTQSAATASQSRTTERSTTQAMQTLHHNSPPVSPACGSGSVIGQNQLPPQNPIPPPLHNQGLQSSNVDSLKSASVHVSRYHSLQSPSPADTPVKRVDSSWNLNVSAGELLGRTHEELVLLLIQLRRQSAGICKAMENCHREIEAQARLIELETSKKVEHSQRLEELKKRLIELEKQYGKGKPLVNLVDNMVKLGSLYRAGVSTTAAGQQFIGTPLREKLEFNHRIQEQRLLAEERKEWDRISPDPHQLQAKVEELYKLDRELQYESSTLQSLKQDKDLLENALGGLKHRIQGTQGNPIEMERYRRQQLLLERELSHVRSILVRNSKKLEETVGANARLEAELVILRQKLEWNQRSSQESLIDAPTVAALENELKRVQMLVGDLQRQRNDLSIQVRQLTEKSKNLCQQIRPSPTGIAGAGPVPTKKRTANGWTETDLDTDIIQDTAIDRSLTTALPNIIQTSSSPYASENDKKSDYFSSLDCRGKSMTHDDSLGSYCDAEISCGRSIDLGESDDKMKRFYGILTREKPQEIKTVRIVKRESERRQRDRDRSGNIGIPISCGNKRNVLEESVTDADCSTLSIVMEERDTNSISHFITSGNWQVDVPSPISNYDYRQEVQSCSSNLKSSNVTILHSPVNETRTVEIPVIKQPDRDGVTDCHRNSNVSFSAVVNEESGYHSDSPQLSPVYQSEAAKQIVQELVLNVNQNSECNRRLVPKEKRRHHTVSSIKPILNYDNYGAASGSRARDDVDMERALRPRLNGTPDVVRSTLSRTDPIKYNAETIDSVIGTPDKILIPERYVPESAPELSPEEQNKRLKKAEAIRKMLSETTSLPNVDENEQYDEKSLAKKNIEEEKRQRDHLLHLNQILAQQVIEKSKLVAGVALSNCS